MPIILDDLSKNVQTSKVKTAMPSYFSKSLTGSGKKTGLLHGSLLPLRKEDASLLPAFACGDKFETFTSGTTEWEFIPMSLFNAAQKAYFADKLPVEAVEISKDGASGVDRIWCLVTAKNAVLATDSRTGSSTSTAKQRTLYPTYYISFFWPVSVDMAGEPTVFRIETYAKQALETDAWDVYAAYYAPLIEQRRDKAKLEQYFDSLTVFEIIANTAAVFAEHIPAMFQSVIAAGASNLDLAWMASRLNYYTVSLEDYWKIYDIIAQNQPDALDSVCDQNLNLLLNGTLKDLEAKKTNIPMFTAVTPYVSNDITLSPEQNAAVTTVDPCAIVQSGAGTGKALPLDEPILTPYGWTKMGDLKVGDMVIGSDGKPHAVLRIHEQGLKSGYRLAFRDGSVSNCCGEHLWTVLTRDRKDSGERQSVITTEQWLNSYHRAHSYLPVVQPVEYAFGKKTLPIDPYLLGALLADGSLCRSSIQYTKSEPSVIKAVKEAAARDGYELLDITAKTSTAKQWRFPHPDDKLHSSHLKNEIRALCLNVKSGEKFIPEIYKTASPDQRRALLNGLFDGDGDIRTGRTYARFNTASERLADDVREILWSLGLIAVKQRQVHKKGSYWSVNLLDGSWDPFLASGYAGQHKGSVRRVRRVLKSAEPFGPVPMRCIEVDAEDKLFVTRDFVVTHNSTVIKHRLRYMEQCGVNLSDTMVLSFTNAAADHIKEIAPAVNSKTIASMIHDIYSMNWTHQLSTIDTLLNIIRADKALVRDPVTQSLVNGLVHLRKDVNQGLVLLSGVIRKHFDAVIAILDKVNQTTLELESLICYHAGGNLKEPTAVCRHVIMDEVQDNSIFEFIYIIRFVIRHQSSLYLVGDGSQTLYEFRASDPKALNCLEMSGVFQCLKLQTNYRSNQNVLDFANLVLATIEANSVARLQLRANSFISGDFEENVRVNYRQLQNRTSALRQSVSDMLFGIRWWIEEKLAKNEQVCFLAYRRKDLEAFTSFVQTVFPDKDLINIVPAKSLAWSFFSKYVGLLGEDLYHRPGADATAEIAVHMQNNASMLCRDRQLNYMAQLIEEWRNKYYAQIMLLDYNIRTAGAPFDTAKFKTEVFQTLIDFEIEKNAMKQRITSMENQKLKAQDMSGFHFICSTIHSAKGLEFDNVILLYDENGAADEENKRMYYVGLTRAKNSEFVLAYNTNHGSAIKTAWETMRDAKAAAKKKAQKDAQTAAANAGAAFTLPVPKPCAVSLKTSLPVPGPVNFPQGPGTGTDPQDPNENEKEGIL